MGGVVPEPALPVVEFGPLEGKRRLFVHRRLGTLHAARAGDTSLEGRLFCGVDKKRTDHITCVLEGTCSQVCSRCFGDDQIAESCATDGNHVSIGHLVSHCYRDDFID